MKAYSFYSNRFACFLLYSNLTQAKDEFDEYNGENPKTFEVEVCEDMPTDKHMDEQSVVGDIVFCDGMVNPEFGVTCKIISITEGFI